MKDRSANIVLIGMPGAGKSTSGILLAKMMSRCFSDTDVEIQARERTRLQDIIDSKGIEAFCRIEEEYLLSINCRECVIATGGSAVYSDRAMKHLGIFSVIVYISLPLDLLMQRIKDLDSRGIVIEPEVSFSQLYAERCPLYEKYADIAVACAGLNHEETAKTVISKLEEYYCGMLQ